MKYVSLSVFLFFILVSSVFAQQAFYGNNGPTFYKESIPVSTVICGDKITFDVPGVSAFSDGSRVIWLTQYKTNLQNDHSSIVKTFDGPFMLPMLEYQTKCGQNEGVFENYVYEAEKHGDTYVKKYLGLYSGFATFTIGASNEARSSTLNDDGGGIFSFKLSRDHSAIKTSYFNVDALVEDFLKTYKDDMDIAIVVPTRSLLDAVQKNSVCDCAQGWRLSASGIGPVYRSVFRTIVPYESSGRFFHIAQVPAINNWIDGNEDTGTMLWTVAHEIGHGWSAYYSNALGMLDEYQAHWARTFSHGNSIMGRGFGIADIGNGTFESKLGPVVDRVFNNWDLYNMGLIPSNQVLGGFVVKNYSKTGETVDKTTYSGERQDINLNSIISSIGIRDPNNGFSFYNHSKDLRVVFLITQGPLGTESEKVLVENKVKELSSLLPQKWSEATRGLSSLSIFFPAQKISKEKNPVLAFLKNLFFTEVLSAALDSKQDLRSIIFNLEKDFSGTHDHEKSSEIKSVDFDGDEKFNAAESAAPNISLAPLTIINFYQVAPPVQTATLSLINQFKQILSRLIAIKNELADLIGWRREL